jgi:hypothetical protein
MIVMDMSNVSALDGASTTGTTFGNHLATIWNI